MAMKDKNQNPYGIKNNGTTFVIYCELTFRNVAWASKQNDLIIQLENLNQAYKLGLENS